MPLLPFALPARRRLGRSLLLGLVVLGLGVQGLSQAVERIAAPAHRHLPQAVAPEALRLAVTPEDPRPRARDDHRRIPWIGEGPAEAVAASDAQVRGAAAALRHADHGVAAHGHALTDPGVIYIDADEDASGSGTKPATAAACPLPAAPPQVACGPGGGHAAWQAARGWHVLAMSSEPLDRPPR